MSWFLINEVKNKINQIMKVNCFEDGAFSRTRAPRDEGDGVILKRKFTLAITYEVSQYNTHNLYIYMITLKRG